MKPHVKFQLIVFSVLMIAILLFVVIKNNSRHFIQIKQNPVAFANKNVIGLVVSSNGLEQVKGIPILAKVIDKPFIIISDPNSGGSVAVDSKKRVVSLNGKDGKQVWSIDIIAEMGKQSFIGKPEIRDISFVASNLVAVVGKHTFVGIDIQTGRVTIQGSD